MVLQWCSAAPALEAVRLDELRRLTDAEALKAADSLQGLAAMVPEPQRPSGLIEQQRLFVLARK